jgi:hypothetical protein
VIGAARVILQSCSNYTADITSNRLKKCTADVNQLALLARQQLDHHQRNLHKIFYT